MTEQMQCWCLGTEGQEVRADVSSKRVEGRKPPQTCSDSQQPHFHSLVLNMNTGHVCLGLLYFLLVCYINESEVIHKNKPLSAKSSRKHL